MRTIIKIIAGVTLVGLTACGNSSQTGSDTSADTTDVTSQAAADAVEETASQANFARQEETARMIFTLVLLPPNDDSEYEALEETVISRCTPSFIGTLKQRYEDEYDMDGLATWLLRTGEQDGPEDTSSIISVTPAGDDAVIVEYSDHGYKASTRLNFIKDGNEYKVNSADVTYNKETRTVK